MSVINVKSLPDLSCSACEAVGYVKGNSSWSIKHLGNAAVSAGRRTIADCLSSKVTAQARSHLACVMSKCPYLMRSVWVVVACDVSSRSFHLYHHPYIHFLPLLYARCLFVQVDLWVVHLNGENIVFFLQEWYNSCTTMARGHGGGWFKDLLLNQTADSQEQTTSLIMWSYELWYYRLFLWHNQLFTLQ